jgi:hypothetical protein
VPEFSSRDPRAPAFWDERFERGFTPWDRGGVPQALRGFVAGAAQPLTTLIPACWSRRSFACKMPRSPIRFLSLPARSAGWSGSAASRMLNE